MLFYGACTHNFFYKNKIMLCAQDSTVFYFDILSIAGLGSPERALYANIGYSPMFLVYTDRDRCSLMVLELSGRILLYL